jgi:antitoxin (DNA-binding transcriptional repressor) of toxin-antitoxin stability system
MISFSCLRASFRHRRADTPFSRLIRLRCHTNVHSVNKATQDTVTVRQLRTDWIRIKRRIARGQRLILTDNGKPIMQLMPLEGPAARKVDHKKYWERRLQRAKEIMKGRSTGSSSVIDERAASKW